MIRVFIAMSLMMLLGCREHSLSKADMRQILHERNEKLGEYFKSGDVQKLVTMYSDSAKLCPNRSSTIYVGRNAIREFWSAASEGSKLLEMNTETLSVDGNSDVIYETGISTTKTLYQDSVYTTKVKFANVWKKQPDGTYLLDVDIWNAVSQ
jgi:ketosteroid isomerase-like protein